MPSLHNGDKRVSSTNAIGKTMSICKRIKLDHYLISYTKINSKWIKALNVTPKAIKLEESIGQKLHNIIFGNLLDMTQRKYEHSGLDKN